MTQSQSQSDRCRREFEAEWQKARDREYIERAPNGEYNYDMSNQVWGIWQAAFAAGLAAAGEE